MPVVEPFPFATIGDMEDRWPDMPTGSASLVGVLLEDASQFILDVCPSAAEASEATRKRIVCSVVRRTVDTDSDLIGLESVQNGSGPFQETRKALNPHGDFYLTAQEKKSLGNGRQSAFTVAFDPIEPARPDWWLTVGSAG